MVLVGSEIDVRVSREARAELLEQRDRAEPTTFDQAARVQAEALPGSGEATTPEIAAAEFLVAAQTVAEQRVTDDREVGRERHAPVETAKAEAAQSATAVREARYEQRTAAAIVQSLNPEVSIDGNSGTEEGRAESQFSAAAAEVSLARGAEAVRETVQGEPRTERGAPLATAAAVHETKQASPETRTVVTAAELPAWIANRVVPEPAPENDGKTVEATSSERADAAGIVLFVDGNRWESAGSAPKTYRVTIRTNPAATPGTRPPAAERAGRETVHRTAEADRNGNIPERPRSFESGVAQEMVRADESVAERSVIIAATAAGTLANETFRNGNAKGSAVENGFFRAVGTGPTDTSPALPEARLPRGEVFSQNLEAQNVSTSEVAAVIDIANVVISEPTVPAAIINSGAPARQNSSGATGSLGESKAFDGPMGLGSPETDFPVGELETRLVAEIQDQTQETAAPAVAATPLSQQSFSADRISSLADTGERGPEKPSDFEPDAGVTGLAFEQARSAEESGEKIVDDAGAAQNAPPSKITTGSGASTGAVAPKTEGEQGAAGSNVPKIPDGVPTPEATFVFDAQETEPVAEFSIEELGQYWEEADAAASGHAVASRGTQTAEPTGAPQGEASAPQTENSRPTGEPLRKPAIAFMPEPRARERLIRPEQTIVHASQVAQGIRRTKIAPPPKIVNIAAQANGRRTQLSAGIRYRVVPIAQANSPKTAQASVSQKRSPVVDQVPTARRNQAVAFIRNETVRQQNPALTANDDASADSQAAQATLARAA